MSKKSAVLAVKGDQKVLLDRFVNTFLSEQESKGFDIQHAYGDTIPSQDMFSSAKRVVVLHDPKDPTLIESFDEPGSVLFLVFDGNPRKNSKIAKFIDTLPKKAVKTFEAPPPWKAEEEAAKFLTQELKTYEVEIGSNLALAWVKKVGTDYGVLLFEIRKLVLLLRAQGRSEATPEDVKGVMAPLLDVGIDPLKAALEACSPVRVARALEDLESRSKGGVAMTVTRMLAPSVYQWAAIRWNEHLPLVALAEEIGVNAWYLQNKVAPSISRWGKKRLRKIIEVLSETERRVLEGSLDPWSFLKAGLIESVS